MGIIRQLKETMSSLWEFQKEQREEKGQKNMFKVIMAENFPCLGREHEAQRAPNGFNPNYSEIYYN